MATARFVLPGSGGPGFKWSSYTQSANDNTLVIPMAESFEFFDNIDEILEVEGIDVINYGPADYSLSPRDPDRLLHEQSRGERALGPADREMPRAQHQGDGSLHSRRRPRTRPNSLPRAWI